MKFIDLKELRDQGYLQEVNRRFFHPLGLALTVNVDDDGNWTIAGVWDCRDDPEGIRFEPGDLASHAHRIDVLMLEREPARRTALGYMVQPAYPIPDAT